MERRSRATIDLGATVSGLRRAVHFLGDLQMLGRSDAMMDILARWNRRLGWTLSLLIVLCSGSTDSAAAQDASDPEARLAALGLALPQPYEPIANYVRSVRTGNLIFLGGHSECEEPYTTGKVGAGRTVEEGYAAARLTALCLLASLKAEIGDLRNEAAAVYVQEQLRQIGVQMEVQMIEGTAARERVFGGDFAAAIYDIALLTRERFFGDSSPMGYPNPEAIRLVTAAHRAVSPAVVDDYYRQLWPILQADLPVTFLFPANWATVAHRRVRGLSSPYRAEPAWYMEHLRVVEGGE